MTYGLDRTLRGLMLKRPEMWTFSDNGLFLSAANVELVKQYHTTWVMSIHASDGPAAYVKLSWLTRLCIEYLKAGNKAKWMGEA